MLDLILITTLALSTLVATTATAVEKRAPGNWQLHPYGDTFDRVSQEDIRCPSHS